MSGSGRSRAATAACTSRTGSWPMARRSWMCPRSYRRRYGSSPRQRPQDRPSRCALGRPCRIAVTEPGPGGGQPGSGGAGPAGRPARRAGPGPHSGHQPDPPAADRTAPGGAKKFLSAAQARALIAATRPRDISARPAAARSRADHRAGSHRPQDQGLQETDRCPGRSPGSTLLQLHGIGPSAAARLLADVGNIHRFASRDHFASWNGTAPLDASSGQQQHHRLSARQPADQPGPAHHGRRPAAQPDRRTRLLRRPQGRRENLDGSYALPKTKAVQYRLPQMLHDQDTRQAAGPGGTRDDSAIQRDRPDPGHRLFGQATSRPATPQRRTPAAAAST